METLISIALLAAIALAMAFTNRREKRRAVVKSIADRLQGACRSWRNPPTVETSWYYGDWPQIGIFAPDKSKTLITAVYIKFFTKPPVVYCKISGIDWEFPLREPEADTQVFLLCTYITNNEGALSPCA